MNTDYMDITLPAYTKPCPQRTHIYLALMQKHRADWRACDYADFLFAAGRAMPLYPAPIDAPTVKCKCCNRPMATAWQESMVEGRDGLWLVTCQSKRCGMNGYTLSAKSYAGVNLADYIKQKA